MSKKSATEAIKKLNPKNLSGVVPQGLDLIKNLKQIQGNPKMIASVGIGELQGMLKHILDKFGPELQQIQKLVENIEKQKEVIEKEIEKAKQEIEKIIP